MTWDYGVEYKKLLDKLDTDKRPWITDTDIPKDGTKIYFMCQQNWEGKTQYDV